MKPRLAGAASRRPAAVLLVVITLLTLFAIVGLAFVLYAESQATSSRVWREANQPVISVDYEEIINFGLGDLIYDAPDDERGSGSGVRGHSLARTAYGWKSQAAGWVGGVNPNQTPFNGTGRIRGLTSPVGGINEIDMVNYTWFSTDGFVRDPEWNATRANPSAGPSGQYTGGANAPYTYPDINNMFLAAVNASGQVVKQSFHAPWLVGGGDWTNTQGRYKIIRPRPQEMGPAFPFPADATGDVKNIVGAPGGNDSYWISLNHPPITLADGKQVVPLYAFCVLPLDSRINVNVVGNYLSGAHTSNQGWGRWEINPEKALTGLAFTPVLNGVSGPSAIVGRFNGANTPSTNAPATVLRSLPKGYAQIDFDANGGMGPVTYTPASAALQPFPTFPTQYQNLTTELNNHPSQYNPYWTSATTVYGNTKAFPASELAYLSGNWGGLQPDVTQVSNSELYKLLNSFNNNPQLMSRVTTISNDLDRPGLAPWILDPTTNPYQVPNVGKPIGPGNYPSATAPTFPAVSQRGTVSGDFDADWRAAPAKAARVDVNRKLAAYPAATNGVFSDPTQAARATADRQALAKDVFTRLRLAAGVPALSDPNLTPPATPNTAGSQQFEAVRWLAQLAVNIVDYTDDDDVITPFNFLADLDFTQTPPRYNSPPVTGWVYGVEKPRLLINEAFAHLSNDPENSKKQKDGDPMTADGDLEFPKPTGPIDDTKPPTAFKDSQYVLDFWLELHNQASAAAPNGSQPPLDGGNARLWVTDGTTTWNPYQIVVRTQPIASGMTPHRSYLRQVWNSKGDLQAAPAKDPTNSRLTESVDLLVTEFEADAGAVPNYPNITAPMDPTATTATPLNVPPSTGGYSGTLNDSQNGFVVLGPRHRFPTTWTAAAPFKPNDPPFVASIRLQEKQSRQGSQQSALSVRWTVQEVKDYITAKGSGFNWAALIDEIQPVFVLRRLANPYLPPNDPALGGSFTYDATKPLNPYVTVDYFEMPPKSFSARPSVNDGVLYNPIWRDGMGTPMRDAAPPTADEQAAFGKFVPMGANNGFVLEQRPTPAATTYPQTTLFRHNGQADTGTSGDGVMLKQNFDWLPHLDRPVASVFELLGVSAVRPHDLTQSFYSGTLGTPGTAGMPNTPATAPTGVQANQHLAPWFTPTSRLYRALELLGTRDLMAGTPMGGRVAGKVNPNNVQNLEVWRAICDANTNSTTLNTDTVSDGIFNALTTARTPGGSPGGSDAPLWGMGAPGVPAGDPQYPTLNDGSGGLPTGSWLRENSPPTPGQTMLLANKNAPQAPFGTEAVSKIAGHLSPRSNCFAVWCTVGLFEVTDAGARPMKLGREYDDTLRRRFFCVIDRTNLSLDPANATRQGPKPVWLRFRPSAPINADDPTASGVVPAGPVTLQVPEATTGTANSLSGTYDGTAWTIRQGDTIFIGVGSGVDAGLNQREAVTVQSVAFAPGASSLTITTTLPHAVNDPVCNVLTGNPGPQGTINYASAPYRDTVIPFAMWLPQ